MVNERKLIVMANGVGVLGDQILEDARRQAAPLKRRAEQEAERIIEGAKEDAQKSKKKLIQDAEREADSVVKRIQARTELDIENIKRRGRENILDEVMGMARSRLAEFASSDDYPRSLKELAKAAISSMNGRYFEIVLREVDRHHGAEITDGIESELKAESDKDVELAIADGSVDSMGGLAVRRGDGKQMCDETYEARLERLWPDLRQEVAEDLDVVELARD